MQTIFRVVLVTVLGIVAAAGAKAADIGGMKDIDNRDRAFIAPASDEVRWGGLWFGALGGYSVSNTNLGLDAFTDPDRNGPGGVNGPAGVTGRNIGNLDGFGGEGFEISPQVGFDMQVGRLVIGAFGEYNIGGVESSANLGDGRFDLEQKDSWCALGRIGVTSGRTLVYAASGYCQTTVETTLTGFGDATVGSDLDFDGIPVEAGIEHKLNDHMRLKLSGRYTMWDEETVFDDRREDGTGSTTSAEPGSLSIKAGIVIGTDGLSLFGN
jgi:hypothetical protein